MSGGECEKIRAAMNTDGLLLRLLDYLLQLYGVVRGRPLLHVRILEDKTKDEIPGGLRFEIENRRRNITSLDPKIVVTYHWLDDHGWHRGRAVYFVRDIDRTLEPFRPKILSATIDEMPRPYWLSWFRTYKFRPTSGITTRIYIRNLLLDPLSRFRFYYEFVRLRIFGMKIDPGGAESYSEWERKRRARGPH